MYKEARWRLCVLPPRSCALRREQKPIFGKNGKNLIIYNICVASIATAAYEGVSITSDITDETRGTRTSPFSPGGYDQAQGAPGR